MFCTRAAGVVLHAEERAEKKYSNAIAAVPTPQAWEMSTHGVSLDSLLVAARDAGTIEAHELLDFYTDVLDELEKACPAPSG